MPRKQALEAGETGQLEVVTDADVERTAVELRAVDHKSAWARTVEVGRLVLGLFGGDERIWRSYAQSSGLSLRRLAEHPACPFKKTALSDAVGIHLFVSRHAQKLDLYSLTPTHVLQVLRLESESALALLRQGADCGWSIRELREKVRALRRESGERRGRPLATVARRAETLALRSARLLQSVVTELSHCGDLGDRDCFALAAALDEVSQLVAAARGASALARRVASCANATTVTTGGATVTNPRPESGERLVLGAGSGYAQAAHG